MNTFPRIALAAALTLSATIPSQAAMVYYLPFDSGTNPSLANQGTAGGNGTVSGTPAPSAVAGGVSKLGGSYYENWSTPTNNQTGAITLPDGNNQFRMNSAGDQMTISTWIYWNGSYNGTAASGIVGAMNASNNVGWSLYINSSGALNFGFNTPTSSYLGRTSPIGTITTGTWLNVALTLSLAPTNGSLAMYVNGTSVYTNNFGSNTINTTTSQTLALGALDYNGTNGSRSLNGSMDDFAMWNTALSAAKIKSINTAPTLLTGYDAGVMNNLFSAYDSQGSYSVGSLAWSYATNFSVTGKSMGDTWLAEDGKYYMWLGGTSGAALGLQAVPEPGSIGLIALGGLCLILRRRRTRRP